MTCVGELYHAVSGRNWVKPRTVEGLLIVISKYPQWSK